MTEETGTMFSGELNGVRLTDLVQLACLGQLTHAISVECSSVFGIIHIHSGQICHVESGSLKGEAGFYEMFVWRGGRFEMTPCGEKCDVRSINKNWEFLLIEAMRQAGLKSSSGPDECNDRENRKEEGFSGTVSRITLLDIVQLMCLGGGSRHLEVECPLGAGQLFSDDGQVFHAEMGGLLGEDAFNEIFKCDNGHFQSAPLTRTDITHTIDKPWEHLLMEAMRLRDEISMGDAKEKAERIESTLQRIQKMKVTEKIRIAMVGDKETRDILIRDPNRMVQYAIVSNPRITEGEIAAIASSKSIEEDVLRRIANSREWMKYYPTRLGLATNPKTPIPISSRLLSTLTPKDLKLIAKSKNVPTALAQAARRMLPERN